MQDNSSVPTPPPRTHPWVGAFALVLALIGLVSALFIIWMYPPLYFPLWMFLVVPEILALVLGIIARHSWMGKYGLWASLLGLIGCPVLAILLSIRIGNQLNANSAAEESATPVATIPSATPAHTSGKATAKPTGKPASR